MPRVPAAADGSSPFFFGAVGQPANKATTTNPIGKARVIISVLDGGSRSSTIHDVRYTERVTGTPEIRRTWQQNPC